MVWRSITAHRQAEASFKQVDAANRNLFQVEHGHNVDRLQKAIEGIGAESAPIREASVHNIGAVISLDPAKFYIVGQKAICGHIRDLSYQQIDQEKKAADMNFDQSPGRFPYNYEILDAFGAFSELKRVYGPEFDRHWKPNLLALRLFNFVSQSTGYVGASFNMSKLTNNDFIECNFSNALFEEAVMNRTSFDRCTMCDCVFRKAEFKYTTFMNCNLTNTDFTQAKLDLRVNQAEADHSTKFIGCTLKDAKVPIEYIDLFPKDQIEEIQWFDGFGQPTMPHKETVTDIK
ncbi:DNA primase [Pseudovibrio sp. FO-BEG1]|nr:DNA primase [Pseudovibrio sp. FO-BEG1]